MVIEMNDNKLEQRLDALRQKLAKIKEHENFEKQLNDGHKKKLEEIERHSKELQNKTREDLFAYEKKHGHINDLERDVIIMMDSMGI